MSEKDELVTRLYNELKKSFDIEAIQHNISFQVQLMAATFPPESDFDLEELLAKIPDLLKKEDFLTYWLSAFQVDLTTDELQKFVDYLESPAYQEIMALLTKVEPLIQSAMMAYATHISDLLLDGLFPDETEIVLN